MSGDVLQICVVVLLCPDLILLSEFYFLITEYTINVSSSGCNQIFRILLLQLQH